MWDDLDGSSEIVAATFTCDHGRVDTPGCHIRGLREIDVDESLVVPEVEIGLGTVIGDEDLAVLVGRHGAWVNVQVGIQFDHGDAQAT